MRILLVEDDRMIAETVKDLIKNWYVVDLAETAEKALYQVETNDYDTLILDIGLPDSDGITLCSKLRENGFTAPIIMLTGAGETSSIVKALDSGADDYVTKPFKVEELLARLRALQRRKEKPLNPTLITVGDLILDPINRHVKHSDRVIELRRKEYLLLEYLMRHPNQVVTRNMILEHVWEDEADPNTNTIDVHVKYLRDKVDKPFGTHYIKTVHGLGYRFDSGEK